MTLLGLVAHEKHGSSVRPRKKLWSYQYVLNPVLTALILSAQCVDMAYNERGMVEVESGDPGTPSGWRGLLARRLACTGSRWLGRARMRRPVACLYPAYPRGIQGLAPARSPEPQGSPRSQVGTGGGCSPTWSPPPDRCLRLSAMVRTT